MKNHDIQEVFLINVHKLCFNRSLSERVLIAFASFSDSSLGMFGCGGHGFHHNSVSR